MRRNHPHIPVVVEGVKSAVDVVGVLLAGVQGGVGDPLQVVQHRPVVDDTFQTLVNIEELLAQVCLQYYIQ
jgi:hypothetical protein